MSSNGQRKYRRFPSYDYARTTTRDGKTAAIHYRVYRTAYKYAMKADKPAEEALSGVRLCLTVDP